MSAAPTSVLRVALAQIAPVFLDRSATLARARDALREASGRGAALVCFGETFVPAYPLWTSRTDGARFDAQDQKSLHAMYLEQGVCIEEGHLDGLRDEARAAGVGLVIGVAERPRDRGGHTLYCSAVFIDAAGEVASVHRKLVPTYEERLSWGAGDGHGLVTHRVGPFTMGALNCWENWMPLARAALQAQGEDLHVALWPGSAALTTDITRFMALEARSYVVSIGAVIRAADIPQGVPSRGHICQNTDVFYDGGSCIAAPDGSWLVAPVSGAIGIIIADLDIAMVRRERQNFDPSGHYARPDVLRLSLDPRRDAVLRREPLGPAEPGKG